jgi:hypothetical protein
MRTVSNLRLRGYLRGSGSAESGAPTSRALIGLFATAVLAAVGAISLGAQGNLTAQPKPAGPLSWLASELGPRADSAPLQRQPARGVHVDLRNQGFDFAIGASHVRLQSSAAGAAQLHLNGLSRSTPFGSETITVTRARTELYDTVMTRQGSRTWQWRLEANQTPQLLRNGSVEFGGLHPIVIAPVKIYGPGRTDVTPKGARWSLERAGSAWNLKLNLVDAGLPLPYVIDPAFSATFKPSPLLRAFDANGATGIWALGDATANGTAPNLETGAGANGGDGTYAASGIASAASLVNDSNAATTFTGASGADNTVSNVLIPSVTLPKTIVMWIKSSSDGASPGAGLLSNRPAALGKGVDFGLDGGRLFAYLNSDGAYWLSNQRVNDGVAHFVAWTNDGTNGCLYIDGVPAPKQTTGELCIAQTFPASPAAHDAFIGLDDPNNEKFNGTIDNVAIFDSTLSANQIAAVYNAGSQYGLTLNAATNTFAAPLPAAGQVTGANGPIPATGPRLFYKSGASDTFTVTENTGDATTTGVAANGAIPNLTQPGTGFTGAAAGPWTSGTYTIGAGLATEVTPTVRISNLNGTADGTFTLTPDAAAPTGGALTVNGVAATSGGTTTTTTSTSFPIDLRTNYAETASASESGLASSNLVRKRHPFLNDACDLGTLEETVTTASGTTNSGIIAGKCYVYTLTGIDNVGNSAAVKTTVRVIGAATHLKVTAPASATAGTAFSVTVTAKDLYENTATGYTGTIAFSSSDSAAVKPANYTFVSGDNGSHAFTNGVTMQTSGSQTITATDTVTSSITGFATVTVNASGADHIVFLQQPTTTAAGATITPAVTVQFRDVFNNPTTSTANVTLAIKSGTGNPAATLSGTLTKAAVAGTATFNDLSIDKTGTGYVLSATAPSAAADSTTFNITPGPAHHLVITSSTADLTTGATRTITAVVKDANDNTVTTDNTTSVTFAKQSGTGTVTGLGSATAASGTASKTVTAATAGSITISASATGLTTGTTTFNIVAAPTPPAGSSGATTPAPVFRGATPADGETVASAKQITLTASADVYWTQMKLRFDPAGGGSSTTTDIADQGGVSATFWIGATTPGLYTLNGYMIGVNGGGKVAFTTHFTVFTPAPSSPPGNSPPTATTVSSTGGGTLTTAAGTEHVTWTPGAFPADAAELRVEPHAVATTTVGEGLSLEPRTLNVTLISSNGSVIHALNAPIEIVIDGAAESDVPATSDDGGSTWRPLAMLPDHALPDNQADGYWREQVTPTTFRIHIWTRHLTVFGLLKDTKAPSSPTGLSGIAGADGITLHWEPSTDNSGTIVSYVVAVNGSAVKTVPSSQTTALITSLTSDDTRVYQVLAMDAAGNMSSLSAGVTQVPTLLGLSLSSATAILKQRGFTVGKVVQDVPGEASSSTVTAQSPLPPALATVGAPVDLKVSAASGQAQLVVLTYEAKKIVVGGKRYIRLRVKVTIPVGLDAFLAGPLGRRYKHWSRHLDAGLHTERFALPSRVKLVKGRPYHLEMYFRSAGQDSGLRRTQIH